MSINIAMFTLEPGEEIVYIARKHWYVFAVRIVALGIVALLPLLALPVIDYVLAAVGGEFDPADGYSFYTFLYLLYLLFVWMIMFTVWTDYYLDTAVITNKRIVDIDQLGLFRRNVSTMPYSMIQDVSTDIEGVIPTMLGYGNLIVQTAATSRDFVFDRISNPNKVKEFVIEQMEKSGSKGLGR